MEIFMSFGYVVPPGHWHLFGGNAFLRFTKSGEFTRIPRTLIEIREMLVVQCYPVRVMVRRESLWKLSRAINIQHGRSKKEREKDDDTKRSVNLRNSTRTRSFSCR